MGKVTNGARPYKPMYNYLDEGNYEQRVRKARSERAIKKTKYVLQKEKAERQEFQYADEIGFIMEVREQKIINTKTLLSTRIYRRCDFVGNLVEDEEIENAVRSVLALVETVKEFIELDPTSKGFTKTALEWQGNELFINHFIQTTRKEKFRLKTAIYTQQCYARAYKDLQEMIVLYCPKKYL